MRLPSHLTAEHPNGFGANNRSGTVHPFRFAAIIILCIVLLALAGCKTPQKAQGSTQRKTQDDIRTELRIDSVLIDRWHTVYTKGDTIIIHDSIDRWRTREVRVHDSINILRIDTIIVPQEIVIKDSHFLRNSGIALWVIICGTLVITGIALALKITM